MGVTSPGKPQFHRTPYEQDGLELLQQSTVDTAKEVRVELRQQSAVVVLCTQLIPLFPVKTLSYTLQVKTGRF